MLLLKQDNIIKRQVDKNVRQIEFNIGNNNKKYKLEGILDNAVYAQE